MSGIRLTRQVRVPEHLDIGVARQGGQKLVPSLVGIGPLGQPHPYGVEVVQADRVACPTKLASCRNRSTTSSVSGGVLVGNSSTVAVAVVAVGPCVAW